MNLLNAGEENKEELIEQVMLGSLLGDGCIVHSKDNKYIYTEDHSIKQKEYLLWKNSILNFRYYIRENRRGCTIKKGNKQFKYLYDLFYPCNIKTISIEILNKISPIALAVWFMDDGCYQYRNRSISLYTQSFGFEGNEIIKGWFKERFKLECSIRSIRPNIAFINNRRIESKRSFFLQFNVKNTIDFIKLIKEYVPPPMFYKIGLDDKRILDAKLKTTISSSNNWIKIKSSKERLANSLAQARKYYLINGEKINARCRKYYHRNKDKILKRRYELRAKNIDKWREYCRNYYHKNKKKLIILENKEGKEVRSISIREFQREGEIKI